MIIKFDNFIVSESTVSTTKEREPLWDDFLRGLYSDEEWVKSVAEEVKKISGANYVLDKIDSDELAMNYASGHQHDHRFPEGDVWRADFDMWEITDSRRNDPPKMYVLGETNARTITNMINKSSMHLGGEAKISEARRYMWPFELLNYLNRNGWSKVKIAEKWYKPHRGWQLVGQLGI